MYTKGLIEIFYYNTYFKQRYQLIAVKNKSDLLKTCLFLRSELQLTQNKCCLV